VNRGYTEMASLKNRDFTYRGVKFHLSDNMWKNEFEGKYKVMFYNEAFNRWQHIGTVDSMKAARKVAQDWFKYNYLYLVSY
jgi:hypothetical protein